MEILKIIILWGGLGAVLTSKDVMYNNWQFWVIILIVGLISLNN